MTRAETAGHDNNCPCDGCVQVRVRRMFPDHDEPEPQLSNGHRHSCPCVACIQIRLDTWGLGDQWLAKVIELG